MGAIRRSVVVLALLVLIVALVRFLFPPFFAPRTHLVLIGSGNNDTFHVAPIPFVEEDYQALGALESPVIHRAHGAWKTARDARSVTNRIKQSGVGASDTLVVYVSAHGVSRGGKAYLLCEDFDLRRPEAGWIAVEELLEQIGKAPGANKLLVINAGQLDYDPRLGIVANEFPRLLEQAVRATGDSTLWVYCSHSNLEYSHASYATQRSVFGMFVSEGLRGAADLNDDKTIRVDELVRFATANVARWVQQQSDHNASQTPRLSWGGGPDPLSMTPSLLTLPINADRRRFDVAGLLERTESVRPATQLVSRDPQTTGVLRRRQLTSSEAGSPNPADSPIQAGEANASNPTMEGGESGAENPQTVGGDGGDESQDASADQQGNASEDSSGGETTEASGDAEKSDPRSRLLQLLSDAWRVRDRYAGRWSSEDPRKNVLERVPHLYRELQAELLGYEQRLRAGAGFDPTSIANVLEAAASADNPETGADQELLTLRPLPYVDPAEGDIEASFDSADSFATARLIAPERTKSLQTAFVTLEAALKKPTRKPFDEWMEKNWSEDYADFRELEFLNRLASVESLEWSLIQDAGRTCIRGERIAASDLWMPGWIRDEIEYADQLRYFAEELLFNRIGPDWQQRVRSLLAKANARYADAESEFQIVRSAEHARDELIDRVPHYLRWCQRMRRSPLVTAHQIGVLEELLDQLAQITDQLDQPEETQVPELARLRDSLIVLRARIESSFNDTSITRFVRRTPTMGDGWRVEQMLQTPLLSSSARGRLLAVADSYARDLASTYLAADVEGLETRPDEPTAREWEALLNQARLESKFIELCQLQRACDEGDVVNVGCQPDCRAVTAAYKTLRESHAAVIEAYGEEQRMPVSASQRVDALWHAYRTFGAALLSFYQQAGIPVGGDVICGESELMSASRSLRMLDPRDAWRYRDVDLLSLSAALRLQSTRRWQSYRRGQAANYEGRSGAIRSSKDAAMIKAEAQECDLPSSTISLTQIAIDCPSVIDLQYAPKQTIEIQLSNLGPRDAIVDVAIDYDHAAIAARLIEEPTNDENRNQDSGPAANDLGNLVGADSLWVNPIHIAAGGQRTIRFELTRKGRATASTMLVVDVRESSPRLRESGTSNESDLELPSSNYNPLLARGRSDIMLPVAEILVQSTGDSQVSNAPVVELHPFPNRKTGFRLGLINQSSQTKQVQIGLHPLDQSFESIAKDELAQVLLSGKAIQELTVTVAGNGQPAFPAREEESPAAAEEAQDAAQPGEGGEPEAAEAPDAKPATMLEHGLLVSLEDLATGQTTFRHLSFAVQRPRRFVRPQVSFNARLNRIEVRVSSPADASFPSGKPIRVNCRLAAPPLGGTEGKLEGVISAPGGVANLFVRMPSPPPQVARLYIDVDEYPRAFTFDVPCGKYVADVPEQVELSEVRIFAASRQGYLAKAETIPVAIQVDAPVGTFDEGNDLVELSLDPATTGVPDPTSAVRLRSDRSVAIGLSEPLPDGTIEILARVSDFEIDLPTRRLENVEVDVASQLILGGSTSKMPPVPLFIDTAPPVVGPLEPLNFAGFAPVGGKLAVSAYAWDSGSGLDRVEAVIDADDSGQFPEQGEFIQATQQSVRKWQLELEAGEDPGRRTLLVRGVDKVGNPSDPIRMPIEVVSLSESSERVEQLTVELSGAVIFRDNLVPDAEVELIAKPGDGEGATAVGKGILAAQTGDNGRFSIAGVAPGSYVLSARGVIHNRVRRTTQEIVISAGPQRTIHVELALP